MTTITSPSKTMSKIQGSPKKVISKLMGIMKFCLVPLFLGFFITGANLVGALSLHLHDLIVNDADVSYVVLVIGIPALIFVVMKLRDLMDAFSFFGFLSNPTEGLAKIKSLIESHKSLSDLNELKELNLSAGNFFSSIAKIKNIVKIVLSKKDALDEILEQGDDTVEVINQGITTFTLLNFFTVISMTFVFVMSLICMAFV